MSPNRRWMAVLMVAAAVPLSACEKTSEVATAKSEAFTVELINEETGLNRLTLTERAAQRMGVKTEKVARLDRFGGESERTAIPYGAVLYEAAGATFTYTSPEPLVFVRHPVTVDYIEGDRAVLLDGPPEGSAVVTDGAAELTGIEFGVGK